MEDQKIGLEVATAAMEAGLDLKCDKGYFMHGVVGGPFVPLLLWCAGEAGAPEFGYAPTQTTLQRRLIKDHGVCVLADLDITMSWLYTICSLHPQASYIGKFITSKFVYSSYEEALDAGLLEASSLIKKQ